MKSRWVIAIMFIAALSGTALFFRLSQHEPATQIAQRVSLSNSASLNEPITPIPLSIKLDSRKVALGRRLFLDPKLSSDNTISCAHCHDLRNGGVDHLPLSRGIGGREVKFNALTVYNSGFNFRLFWDGRAATLEDQIDFPLQDHSEMGSRWDDVIIKLKADADYQRDFSAIYQDGISDQSVKDAIATFERSLITPNARFDRYLRGEKNVLDSHELEGYRLFKKLGCISCHQGMNVGGNMYEKLGLVGNYYTDRGHVRKEDFGRYNLTGEEEDRYEFRVPSLRNVELTAPYFHDGSAATLYDAVKTMARYQLGVELDEADIARIVSFLHTLTGVFPDEAAR